MEGYGTYRFPSGTVYSGEFLDGEFHGEGTLQFADQGKYHATWDHGVALKGRYVFGDSLALVSRSHFADLGSGMLTLFQLFTGDSWTTVLYQLLESQDGNQYGQVCVCPLDMCAI